MNNSTTTPQHLVWVDYLRVIACFMMVLAHSCDPFVGQFYNNYSEFLNGSMIGSFMRACVPLFVMVSGVLLLPVNMPMGQFYKRRLSRVLWPLLVWSVLTPVLYFAYMSNMGSINPLLDASTYTWSSALNKIAVSPLSFNYDTTPLWYLYMLVGLYLMMPIISPWLRESSAKTIRVFLYLWGASLLVPYLTLAKPFLAEGSFAFGTMGLFGVCDWNPFGTFYYFSGFLGYIILAYYLVKYPLSWSLRKSLIICVPMFIVGGLITALGFLYVQSHFPGNYPMLEQIWFFNSLNVAMMTFALFVIISKINWRPSPLFASLATLMFGVYLSHFLIVNIAYDYIYTLPIPVIVKILTIALTAFVTTILIVFLLKKLPKSKYIIG